MKDDKKLFTSKMKCVHCGNIAPMELAAKYVQSESMTEQIDEEYTDSWEEGTIYRLLACQACAGVVLERDYYDTRYDDMAIPNAYTTLYPQQDTMPKVLPAAVKTEYEAAVRVKPISANAYAVLLGRVFDKVCEDRQAKGKTLSEKLADLAGRGEIPTILAEMAQGLRQLRNVGAHADLGDLTPEETLLLDAILRAILEYLYRAPKLVAEVKGILAKRKPGAP